MKYSEATIREIVETTIRNRAPLAAYSDDLAESLAASLAPVTWPDADTFFNTLKERMAAVETRPAREAA